MQHAIATDIGYAVVITATRLAIRLPRDIRATRVRLQFDARKSSGRIAAA